MKLSNEQRNFLAASFWGAVTLGLVNRIWPGTIPFTAFSLWAQHDSVSEWFTDARGLLAWGAGLAILVEVLKGRSRLYEPSAGTILGAGLAQSLFAGVFEELGFRWLIFLSSIFWVKVTNWFFFGCLGFGILEWFFVHVLGPLANWTTFGYLQPQLLGGSWAVGAALLSSNAFFRDGHRYQGWFGTVNAWFAGMFFFWMTFHHGLLSAIIVHFTYDAIIDVVRALSRKLRD